MGAKRDRLYFLPKDPWWTFLQWEISDETLYLLGVEMGRDPRQMPLRLRIHDVTDILFDGRNSHSRIEVVVEGPADHWYLRLPYPNRVYCAEAGFQTEDGRYFPAARSNTLHPPRLGVSERREERWSTLQGF